MALTAAEKQKLYRERQRQQKSVTKPLPVTQNPKNEEITAKNDTVTLTVTLPKPPTDRVQAMGNNADYWQFAEIPDDILKMLLTPQNYEQLKKYTAHNRNLVQALNMCVSQAYWLPRCIWNANQACEKKAR